MCVWIISLCAHFFCNRHFKNMNKLTSSWLSFFLFSFLLHFKNKVKDLWQKSNDEKINVVLETKEHGHKNDIVLYGDSTIYLDQIDKTDFTPYVLKNDGRWYCLIAKNNGRTIVTSREKAVHLAVRYQKNRGRKIIFHES